MDLDVGRQAGRDRLDKPRRIDLNGTAECSDLPHGMNTSIRSRSPEKIDLLTDSLDDRFLEHALDGSQGFAAWRMLFLPPVEVRAVIGNSELVAGHAW